MSKRRERVIVKGISDTRCRNNSIRAICRCDCRNNCKQWDRINKICKLGYR